MENLEKNTTEKYTEKNINLDELAENYAEKVRQSFIEFKAKENDPHLKNINPSELNHGDLILFDKLQKGTLSEYELNDYRKSMEPYFKLQVEQAEKEGKNSNIGKDSRSVFSAMVGGRLLSQLAEKKFIETEKEKLRGRDI